ncbi:LacI family DNA-binding transcriptional regulator [Pseudonocardia sp. GCM10023141]|uniref:LacI family DNA-binding transcriptional regulator n=1 Tax=Pseudonocardia sp. GCM10023141 TaxID=3252653 RepID=UPI0036D25DCF
MAKLAGVGRSTVSRVITGSPLVSGVARQAVETAIAKIGYVPNAAARSLVTRRTDAIAVVITSEEIVVGGYTYLHGVLRGISNEAAARDRQLVLAFGDDLDRLDSYLARHVVDGVVLISSVPDGPSPWQVQRARLPVVLAGRPQGWTGSSCVTIDNEGGSRAAVDHLIATGSERTAMITGSAEFLDSRERYAGYVAALRAAGRDLDPALVAEGDFRYPDSGEHAMNLLLQRDPHVDGVFAASDTIAIGALRALAAAGRRVPDDVRVIGFDDDPLAARAEPPLSTVRVEFGEIGKRAVSMLLDLIAAGDGSDAPSVVVGTELVLRASA